MSAPQPVVISDGESEQEIPSQGEDEGDRFDSPFLFAWQPTPNTACAFNLSATRGFPPRSLFLLPADYEHWNREKFRMDGLVLHEHTKRLIDGRIPKYSSFKPDGIIDRDALTRLFYPDMSRIRSEFCDLPEGPILWEFSADSSSEIRILDPPSPYYSTVFAYFLQEQFRAQFNPSICHDIAWRRDAHHLQFHFFLEFGYSTILDLIHQDCDRFEEAMEQLYSFFWQLLSMTIYAPFATASVSPHEAGSFRLFTRYSDKSSILIVLDNVCGNFMSLCKFQLNAALLLDRMLRTLEPNATYELLVQHLGRLRLFESALPLPFSTDYFCPVERMIEGKLQAFPRRFLLCPRLDFFRRMRLILFKSLPCSQASSWSTWISRLDQHVSLPALSEALRSHFSLSEFVGLIRLKMQMVEDDDWNQSMNVTVEPLGVLFQLVLAKLKLAVEQRPDDMAEILIPEVLHSHFLPIVKTVNYSSRRPMSLAMPHSTNLLYRKVDPLTTDSGQPLNSQPLPIEGTYVAELFRLGWRGPNSICFSNYFPTSKPPSFSAKKLISTARTLSKIFCADTTTFLEFLLSIFTMFALPLSNGKYAVWTKDPNSTPWLHGECYVRIELLAADALQRWMKKASVTIPHVNKKGEETTRSILLVDLFAGSEAERKVDLPHFTPVYKSPYAGSDFAGLLEKNFVNLQVSAPPLDGGDIFDSNGVMLEKAEKAMKATYDILGKIFACDEFGDLRPGFNHSIRRDDVNTFLRAVVEAAYFSDLPMAMILKGSPGSMKTTLLNLLVLIFRDIAVFTSKSSESSKFEMYAGHLLIIHDDIKVADFDVLSEIQGGISRLQNFKNKNAIKSDVVPSHFFACNSSMIKLHGSQDVVAVYRRCRVFSCMNIKSSGEAKKWREELHRDDCLGMRACLETIRRRRASEEGQDNPYLSQFYLNIATPWHLASKSEPRSDLAFPGLPYMAVVYFVCGQGFGLSNQFWKIYRTIQLRLSNAASLTLPGDDDLYPRFYPKYVPLRLIAGLFMFWNPPFMRDDYRPQSSSRATAYARAFCAFFADKIEEGFLHDKDKWLSAFDNLYAQVSSSAAIKDLFSHIKESEKLPNLFEAIDSRAGSDLPNWNLVVHLPPIWDVISKKLRIPNLVGGEDSTGIYGQDNIFGFGCPDRVEEWPVYPGQLHHVRLAHERVQVRPTDEPTGNLDVAADISALPILPHSEDALHLNPMQLGEVSPEATPVRPDVAQRTFRWRPPSVSRGTIPPVDPLPTVQKSRPRKGAPDIDLMAEQSSSSEDIDEENSQDRQFVVSDDEDLIERGPQRPLKRLRTRLSDEAETLSSSRELFPAEEERAEADQYISPHPGIVSSQEARDGEPMADADDPFGEIELDLPISLPDESQSLK